jgi:hypothetical protein
MTRPRASRHLAHPRRPLARASRIGRLVMVSQVVGLGPDPRLPRNTLHLTSCMYHIIRVASVLRRDDHAHAPSGAPRPGTPHIAHGEVYAPRRHNTHTSRLTRVCMHSERAVCASLISLWPFSGISFLCCRSVAYSERANAHAAVCSRPSPAPPAIARRLRVSSPATLLVLVARVTLVLRDDLLLDVGRHNLI